MQIDFDAITDLIFDGVDLTEVSINGEVIWTSSPIAPPTYSLYFSYDEGVSGDTPPEIIQAGEEVIINNFSVDPRYSYSIGISNAEYRIQDNQLIIYNAVGDVIVEITSIRRYYNLDVSIEPQGSAWTDAPSQIDDTGFVRFNIYPEDQYEIDYIDVDNAFYELDGNSITLYNASDDTTVTIHLRIKEVSSYLLTVNVWPNASAEIFAPSMIYENEEVAININPHPGYVLVDIQVSNAEYRIEDPYTIIISNATADVTVDLSYAN